MVDVPRRRYRWASTGRLREPHPVTLDAGLGLEVGEADGGERHGAAEAHRRRTHHPAAAATVARDPAMFDLDPC